MNDLAKQERDAPRLAPPSEEELRLLPLRALVAYAARCARRVEPVYMLPSDHPDRESHKSTIDRAIRFAEDSANGAVIPVMPAFVAAKEAEAAAEVAKAIPTAVHSMFSAYSASYVAWASHVASTELTSRSGLGIRAFEIAQEVGKQKGSKAGEEAAKQFLIPRRGSYTARFAAVSGASAANSSPLAIGEMRNDYEQLLGLDLGSYPKLGSPVDPSEDGPLGPLWREGTPSWYAVDQNHPFYDEILQFFVSTISAQALLSQSPIDEAVRKGDGVTVVQTPSKKELSIPLPDPRDHTYMTESQCRDMCEYSPAATVDYLFGHTGRPTQLLFAMRPAPSALADQSGIGGQLEHHVGPSLEILACHLVGGGYERYRDGFYRWWGSDKTWPPELQFFRHLRNGCFHSNVFNFQTRIKRGPQIDSATPPVWHTYTMPSDAAMQGQQVMDGFFRLPHVLPFPSDMGRFVQEPRPRQETEEQDRSIKGIRRSAWEERRS